MPDIQGTACRVLLAGTLLQQQQTGGEKNSHPQPRAPAGGLWRGKGGGLRAARQRCAAAGLNGPGSPRLPRPEPPLGPMGPARRLLQGPDPRHRGRSGDLAPNPDHGVALSKERGRPQGLRRRFLGLGDAGEDFGLVCGEAGDLGVWRWVLWCLVWWTMSMCDVKSSTIGERRVRAGE